MSSVNVVVLVGRLTRDAELKYTPSGTAVCEFSLAIDRAGDMQDGEPGAGFFDVQLWGQSAERIADWLVKGKQVGVQGELKHHRWEAQDGTKRSKVEIKTFQVQLLGSKSDNQSSSEDDASDRFEPATSGQTGSDFGPIPADQDIPF